MTAAFTDSTRHLLAALERVDLLIRARVAHLRRVQRDDEQFRGLYISEAEVDELLRKPLGAPQWMLATDPARWAEIDAAAAALAVALDAGVRASLDAGVDLRLVRLERGFALERFEVDVLLACLAVELDQRYEKLFAYLQDDVTRKRPTVDLMLNLLTDSPAETLAARRHFAPDGALFRHRLVQAVEDASPSTSTLLSRTIGVDERVVRFLLGSDAIDGRLRTSTALHAGPAGFDRLLLDPAWAEGLRSLLSTGASGNDPVLHFTGPAGCGKTSLAAALAAGRGQALLVVRTGRLLSDAGAALPAWLDLLEREAKLQNASLLFADVDVLRAEPQAPSLALLRDALQSGSVPCFLAGAAPWNEGVVDGRRRAVQVDVPRASAAQRLEMWTRVLQGVELAPDADLQLIALRFRLTFGQIEAACDTARRLARRRAAAEAPAPVSAGDLFDACRSTSSRSLDSLARKVLPRYGWNDLVLPPDQLAQLQEICNHMRYRDRVYEDWGFGGKLAMGKGLTMLFAGPSGTGKTMAADVIAGTLGLDLYKIDLSSVVSKYIGDTEKNLSRIFDDAESSNAILFFDEADALFGKRSEVKDSHDRYANIEVGYLLQRMEQYEGVAILATNLRKNMDEAFVRRLHFTLDLPFPGMAERLRIWQGVWPKNMPRSDDIDLDALARRFELTGGNIRNVALAAAFLAADDENVVHMNHVLHAVQREQQKTRKLLRPQDFN